MCQALFLVLETYQWSHSQQNPFLSDAYIQAGVDKKYTMFKKNKANGVLQSDKGLRKVKQGRKTGSIGEVEEAAILNRIVR